MRTLAALWICLALAACANVPPMPPPGDLFHDELFAPPSVRIDPDAALALSPAMHDYLAARFGARSRQTDRRRQLIEALYHGELRLEYDADMTRTAAEAFDARSGNCLSLVMMTAAFAKALGLTVHYQSVVGEEAWSRADDVYIAIGHVNLLLEDTQPQPGMTILQLPLVVDFLPPRDAMALQTREIDEPTVVAMYLNNRAVESLTSGHADDAYWFARAAIGRDPTLLASYVTLGVVYRGRQQSAFSEQVLQRVAAREPDNLYALSNRVLALRDLGRTAEADALAARLAALDPHPPFSYFRDGIAALHSGQLDAARRLFAKEVARAPYHHEFEYWLAVTYMAQGDAERATVHLHRAMDISTTRKDHELYAGKLARLKAIHTQ